MGCFHRLNIPDQAAQPVQLIEQMQNDRNALVVDAEIRLEIRINRARARSASEN